jgi:hypothetical protein
MTEKEISTNFRAQKRKHLILSLLIDALGMLSYLLPVLGEVTDVFYGPISGVIIFMMYKQNPAVGIIGGLFGAGEEMFVADFVPTATLLWLYTYKLNGDKTFKQYKLNNTIELEVK